ncbi:putative nuclease HARBI1 isoform X2 [Photinus pyralis]|uniref:Putative nuclease HARBI1 n=1 Tax=Photinus pyralis TaxID=7054 RepID=A0A1Y1LPG9_PHOPY|nr:putative nuclease HARBI1 isoform X2 [Photinus pyralis]XP_031348901.1 putative nuclease HARBI1 isoform X2 [Photinus pyralis]
MHQSSVSRCITEVTDVMVEVLGYTIQFPEGEAEKNQEKQLFIGIGGFPGIIGCIDGTQIAIVAPKTEHPEMPGVIFYCRKQYYSLNVQIICNAQLKITNINARFPGSVHDSAIWQTSLVRRHLVNNYVGNRNQTTYLLGDSGYPLEPWLLTPIANPLTDAERQFNRRHINIRNTVERTIGVLKQRFRCCLKHRTLHYSPERAAHIIYSAAILHNLCITRNEYLDDINGNGNGEEFNDCHDAGNIDNNIDGVGVDHAERNFLRYGRNMRNRVVDNYCI